MSGKVCGVNFLRLTFLKVLEKTRPFGSYTLLWLVAVEQGKARRYVGRSARQGFHNILCHMARARENRLHECSRDFPFLHLFLSENKKAVCSSSKAALNAEQVSEIKFITVSNVGRGRELRPLVGAHYDIQGDQRFAFRALNRSRKSESDGVIWRW